jgi:protein TonB
MQFTDHMKSNFTPYILVSLLTHLLLTAVFYAVAPDMESRTSIFNVDIVTPEQSAPPKSEPPPGPESIVPPVQKIKPPLIRRPRISPETKLPPETLHGGSTGTGDKESTGQPGSTSPDKTEKSAAGTGTGEPSFSPPVEKGLERDESGGAGLAPPSYLFDRETIEKFARKGAPENRGLTFDTSGFKNRGYMRMLKERIESIWKYPKKAARQGISGDLYMQFTIKKDGSLGNVELLRTSGHSELDDAAVKAIKRAAPFWPLPEDWDKDDLEIKGHFIYVFGGTMAM